MNLFPYTSAIALSFAGVVDLSPAFILNFMQLSVRSPSVEMMPCRIAFLFSYLVFHKSCKHIIIVHQCINHVNM